jgi:holo-[acyl-carrier protein] synthase
MDQQTRLREVVARLGRVEPEQVRPDFPLAEIFASSLGVHLLESAVREHLRMEPPPLRALRTYSELEAAVLGPSNPPSPGAGSEAGPRPAPVEPPVSLPAGLSCGLDVEQVAKFPEAQDYWAHDFYANTFTKTEIAYCARQAHPRRHFAARWCAKEALKKTDPAYLKERMVDIQVHHDEQGVPVLQSARTQQILPYALSLSHSDDTAAAVVIRLGRAPLAVTQPDRLETTAGDRPPAPPRAAHSMKGAALILAVLSILVSCAALLRAWGL